jgi:hypothetical protein
MRSAFGEMAVCHWILAWQTLPPTKAMQAFMTKYRGRRLWLTQTEDLERQNGGDVIERHARDAMEPNRLPRSEVLARGCKHRAAGEPTVLI